MSLDKKSSNGVKRIQANVNLLYSFLLFLLGLNVGYYLVPYLTQRNKQHIDVYYGIYYYKKYLEEHGTFSVTSDTSVIVIYSSPYDSIKIRRGNDEK